MASTLIFLVSGNADEILECYRFNVSDTTVIKLDDKDLSKPGLIMHHIHDVRPSAVYFACRSIDMQRFIPFMHIYLWLARVRVGGILSTHSRMKLNGIMQEVVLQQRHSPLLSGPFSIVRLLVETVASIGVVVVWTPYIWFLKELYGTPKAQHTTTQKER